MKRDQEIFDLIEKEHQRQLKGIELIASENFVSDEVMEAMGSYLTNKYAEGYPGKRYYGGCGVVDQVEQLAIDRVCKLFVPCYLPRPQPCPRRTSFTRFGCQHIGHSVQGRRLRPQPRDRTRGLRPDGKARTGEQAETHHWRRFGIQP